MVTVPADSHTGTPAPVWQAPEQLPPAQPRQIGAWLLMHNLVTREQLERAVAGQGTDGGLLGEHLVADGAVTGNVLYDALAALWQAPRIDISTVAPDLSLMKGLDARKVLGQGWIPIARDETTGTITVATTAPPGDRLTAKVHELLGEHEVEYRTATPGELIELVGGVFRDDLLFDVTSRLAEDQPDISARQSLMPWQKVLPFVFLGLLAVGLVVRAELVFIVLLAAANIAFAANVGFRLLATIRWPIRQARRTAWEHLMIKERHRRGMPLKAPSFEEDESMPMYTILVPAFREANVIHKIIANLDALDYPKSRMEVLVLLEEEDLETIEAAYAANPPSYMRVIIVPRGNPQTKPRACNYGLTFARGEFVVIYDAEDKPEPDQLRRMVAEFRWDSVNTEPKSGKPLVCVQCGLNYFNAEQNVLTRMFAIEYSFWFDAMLPGLDNTGIPIPLGGTSNHFRTDMLRRLGGWDPYNVTEDADLGMRASAMGYRVGVSTSVTWEEACSQTPAWIKQRTRWIKGYMITAAVNFRHPVKFVRATGFRGLLSLVGLIAGTPLAFLLYPIMLGFTIATYVATRVVTIHLPDWLLWFGGLNMLIGAGSMIALSAGVAAIRHGWRIAGYAIFSPIYWLLHSVASYRAAWQTLFSPHQWEKTPHGLDEFDEEDEKVVAVGVH
ncbi:glycosyltransferase [Nakamurella sp. YIM 132087]|uniref:Glycosyltransferase n=2 Tax=Nakamurella alba TaxID=2665158 RepID=A0A7K1FP42_9ACTN|nr:glycosyltransferase [Nakamurella alba]